MAFSRHVGVIGGYGNLGLPLALMFADDVLRTVVYDPGTAAVDKLRRCVMPFWERGVQELLETGSRS